MHDVVLMWVFLESGQADKTRCAKIPLDFGAKIRHSFNLLRHTFLDPKDDQDFALLYSAASIDVNAIDGTVESPTRRHVMLLRCELLTKLFLQASIGGLRSTSLLESRSSIRWVN